MNTQTVGITEAELKVMQVLDLRAHERHCQIQVDSGIPEVYPRFGESG